MIGEAFSYPLEPGAGRRALVVVAAATLVVATGARAAGTLYPLVLALVPAALAGAAALALAGTLVGVLVDPDAVVAADVAAPDDAAVTAVAGGTLRDGAVATGLALAVLAVPVALLLGSVSTFGDLEPGLDPGAPLFLLLASTSALLAFFAATYALPPLVAAGARDGRLRDALDGGRLRRVLGDPGYFLAWTIGLPTTVLGAGIGSFAVGASGVGGLFAAVTGAYLLVAGVHVLGSGERAARGAGRSRDRASGGPDAPDGRASD